MEDLHVIKIGGKVLEDAQSLDIFLKNFSDVPANKILIHGGASTTNLILEKMGIIPEIVEGRRITDEKTLDVIVMTYAGLLNKRIIAKLIAYGCNALGLSGADLNTILAEKREVLTRDYGYAGDIKNINTNTIVTLLQSGITPVFCSVTHNGKGQLLNTNADTIAATVAASLAGHFNTSVWICFEREGILKDVNDKDSLIHEVNSGTYQKLLEQGIITNGMRPKLENAFYALKRGVRNVYICHYSSAGSIPEETGTRICL